MAIETINSKVNVIWNVMLSIVSFHSSEGGGQIKIIIIVLD